MRLRSLVAAAAVTALGISLAACGGSDSGDSSGGSSGGDQTLTYWASNQGTSLDNDKEVLTPVLQKFTQETGIKVNLEVIGWNDLQTRIQTAITSGQAPDVWATHFSTRTAVESCGATRMSEPHADPTRRPGTRPSRFASQASVPCDVR